VRFTCFGGEKLSNRKYGVMNSVARFTPEKVEDGDTTIYEGWIEIGPNASAYGRARNYNNVKMFYNSCFEPCALQVLQDGELIHEEDLQTDGKYHSIKLSFPANPGVLKYIFKSRLSPNIMGFSLDGDYGVQVDNIAMRGSSGTFLGTIDQSLFAQQLSDVSAEMIIMQFGGNSMPMLKNKQKVENFAKYIQGQLRVLKRLRPNALVLFIGPSDMSTLIDGTYQTYPMLPYCVEQLKKVTKGLGIPYWDLFDAMGGKNSMPSWVEKELAGKDYIHFSPKGASIASQLFYDALINKYQEKPPN
jgi:lysophospholipase L1-like esterase